MPSNRSEIEKPGVQSFSPNPPGLDVYVNPFGERRVYRNLPTYQWLVFVAAAGIFGGAFMIGRFREGKHRSPRLDVFARIVFSAGFLVNLHNLARAAEVI